MLSAYRRHIVLDLSEEIREIGRKSGHFLPCFLFCTDSFFLSFFTKEKKKSEERKVHFCEFDRRSLASSSFFSLLSPFFSFSSGFRAAMPQPIPREGEEDDLERFYQLRAQRTGQVRVAKALAFFPFF